MPAKTHHDLIQMLEQRNYEALRDYFSTEEIECEIPEYAAFKLTFLIDVPRNKLSYVVAMCRKCFDTQEVKKLSGNEVLIAVARRTAASNEIHKLAEYSRSFPAQASSHN